MFGVYCLKSVTIPFMNTFQVQKAWVLIYPCSMFPGLLGVGCATSERGSPH